MKTRKFFVSLLFVLIALILVVTAVAAQEELDLVRLTVDNRTDQAVALSLTGTDTGARYYLVIGAGDMRVFTVERDDYTHITLACGRTAEGTVDINRQLFLNFTSCYSPPPNQGTPGIEKIFIPESPTKTQWQYQFD